MNSYKEWLSKSNFEVKKKLNNLTEEEIKFNFNGELEFGTAGLRGIMGYGTSVMNEYNIAKYTLALAKTFLNKDEVITKKYGVVIAHDNRNNSEYFARITAEVFSALEIPAFLFKDNILKPTPILSYVISEGKYVGGVNITASHNPKEYNGYKVYGSTGAQLRPETTKLVEKFASEPVDIFAIEKNNKNVFFLKDDVVQNYIERILKDIPFKDIDKQKNIKIIYTSQHGTATPIAKEILDRMNIDYHFVKEQMNPDGNFTNTVSANPQVPDSFIKAREYGDKYNADVLFCTDPDADRFGIEVKHKNKWVHINGNELPMIQLLYKIEQLKKINQLSRDSFVVRSVVTSNAADNIAKKNNIDVYESLTGFKWIINKALELEKQNRECIFAWEESYGSTVRTFTRDKDSFQALIQVIEIVDEYKQRNMTLVDAVNEIYDNYGYYKTSQIQLKFPGINGKENMLSIIDDYKNTEIGSTINNYKVVDIVDFSKGYKNLPKDNFVSIFFEKGSKITLRPSGTEPILRIYFDICDSVTDDKKYVDDMFSSLSLYFENELVK